MKCFSDVYVGNDIFGVGRKTRIFGSEQFLYLPASDFRISSQTTQATETLIDLIITSNVSKVVKA